jgi:uncharacterized membrane protein
MFNLAIAVGGLIERLPQNVQEGLETVKANPVLMWTLVGVGAVTALVFIIGLMKSAFKAAILGALLSAAAWIWYFKIR